MRRKSITLVNRGCKGKECERKIRDGSSKEGVKAGKDEDAFALAYPWEREAPGKNKV